VSASATALLGDEFRERLRVAPGASVDLGTFDPRETLGHRKEESSELLDDGRARLEESQERLWAGRQHAVLVILQGMDTSGKDGTLRHVAGAFNPQGCHVVGFGVPTPDELAHDFLWRIHRHTPGKGTIAIFNRSQYEDVLVVRVHELVAARAWRPRYEQINEFEESLVENGTTILKFFLHISKDEQRERLQARLDAPDKRWKFKRGDLDERRRWDEYVAAYEEALTRCTTEAAPWYVIPADRKWFRNLAVAEILAVTLHDLDLRYPEPEEGLDGLVVE
jgi:PPK2 family polyphosphate:nucleotide phosphotransferase